MRLEWGVREEDTKDDPDWVDTNELLSAYIDAPERVSIHISEVDGASVQRKYQLFKEGLKKLAEFLRSDPRMASVNTITATSWIVTEAPELMEKLGFTVDDNSEHPLAKEEIDLADEKKYREKGKMTFAWISREDFLKRYASINQPQTSA